MYQIYMPMVDFYKKYLKYLKKRIFLVHVFIIEKC